MEKLTLKQARRLRGKTQDNLADHLGIHVQTYRKIEENPNEATIGQAKEIAAFLEYKYDIIFFG